MTDRDAILELGAKYMHTIDLRDREGWLSCWTEDGYFERYGSDNRAKGVDELGTRIFDKPRRGFHITSDHAITVSGDDATATCYLLYVDEKNRCEVVMFGVYRDTLRREPDGWRYSSRIFEPHYIHEDVPNVAYREPA